MNEAWGRIGRGLALTTLGAVVGAGLSVLYERDKQQDIANAAVADVNANFRSMLEEDGLGAFQPGILNVDTEFPGQRGALVSPELPIRKGWVDLKVGSCTLKQVTVIFDTKDAESLFAPHNFAFDPSVDGIALYRSSTHDESFTDYKSFTKRALELDKGSAGTNPSAEDYCEVMQRVY
jgi:hypothetical protein